MKTKLFTYCIAICFTVLANAQAPNLMNYQAVLRDNTGTPMLNHTVGAQFTIRDNTSTGTVLYQETQTLISNGAGVLTAAIGSGTIVSGSFATINWGSNSKYLDVQIDPAGGTAYQDFGNSQLLSVPYALSAGSSSQWYSNGSQVINTDSTAPVEIFSNKGYPFSIVSSTSENYTSYANNGGQYRGYLGIFSDPQGIDLGTYYGNTTGTVNLVISDVPKLTVAPSGFVGIGTTTPNTALQVIGNPSAVEADGFFQGLVGNATGDSGSTQSFTHTNYASSYHPQFAGVQGNATGAGASSGSAAGMGVIGSNLSSTNYFNWGVYAEAANATSHYNYAIFGENDVSGDGANFAGYFKGDVIIYGALTVTGAVTAGVKDYKIDNPLDPANKYLVYTCPESPEMLNVYSGNITTNNGGIAVVALPDYFEMINTDPRYQLTVIGGFAQAIIKDKVSGNRFTIQTDKPNTEVSWQVTGVRNDKWAQAHRTETEPVKTGDEKGKYLYPELYGKPAAEGITHMPQVGKTK